MKLLIDSQAKVSNSKPNYLSPSSILNPDYHESRSSLSDFICSESSAQDKLDEADALIFEYGNSPVAVLLEYYNDVFTQLQNLKAAIGELVQRVSVVSKLNKSRDSMHGKLFSTLGHKLKEISRAVENSNLFEQSSNIRNNRYTSLSLMKGHGRENTQSTSNLLAAPSNHISNASTRAIQTIQTIPLRKQLADRSTFITPVKQKAIISVRSEERCGPIMSTSSPVKVKRARPSNDLASSIELQMGELTNVHDSQTYKKTNYFDIIANLMKLNFIDHDQVVILKKSVIKRDERVLKPLRMYESNKDLHILIQNLASIMEGDSL